MSKIKILSILVVAMGASVNAHAAMKTDFSRCAESALAAQKIKAKSIRVEIPAKDFRSMDHNPSLISTEYYLEMELAGKNSGKSLGRVKCSIDKSGKVTSINFDT